MTCSCGCSSQVRAACEKFSGSSPPVVQAVGILVDVLQSSGDAAEAARATQLCVDLRKLDPIRERYWAFRAEGGLGAGGAPATQSGTKPAPEAGGNGAEAVAVM